MNSTSFAICTYNMGSNKSDYARLFGCLTNEQIDNQEFTRKYELAQQKTADLLIEKNADVYCLQEVRSANRPVIRMLLEKNFSLIHIRTNKSFDSALLLNNSRFEGIHNLSHRIHICNNFNKDVAMASAWDKLTNKKFLFISAHVPGFKFQEIIDSHEARKGDIYCEKIITIASTNPFSTIIMGADMNANRKKWPPRFELFTKEKFQRIRTKQTTNINPYDDNEIDQKKEIDFIFIRQPLDRTIASVFQKTLRAPPIDQRWEDREINASDHRPVFYTIPEELLIKWR